MGTVERRWLKSKPLPVTAGRILDSLAHGALGSPQHVVDESGIGAHLGWGALAKLTGLGRRKTLPTGDLVLTKKGRQAQHGRRAA